MANHLINTFYLLTVLCFFSCEKNTATDQVDQSGREESANIRLNQVGYYLNAPKKAVVVSEKSQKFRIVDANSGKEVLSGSLMAPQQWEYSEETVAIADFSSLNQEGQYYIDVEDIGKSYTFEIKSQIFHPVLTDAIRSYYYNRCSFPIEEQYGGKWHRAAGHPDQQVKVHPSAATDDRPAGYEISAPKGWYDAGDYNKYIVNSGITTYTLLAAYENFPSLFDQLQLKIPESTNQIPDLLDEALWNIRWMLQMQDPDDGGVYHKLTHPNFTGFVMPEKADNNPRYVIQKSTAAALDFAAVMAQTARIFSDLQPALADSALEASLKAWNWARSNPEIYYLQNRLNSEFDPDISTGAYGDRNVQDEFLWASLELYITTQADSFYVFSDWKNFEQNNLPSWPNVSHLGLYSLSNYRDQLSGIAQADLQFLDDKLLELADPYLSYSKSSAYQTAMGTYNQFVWGSNSSVANQGILLVYAYQISGNSDYLLAALDNMDYLLGRNATGYCFLTGHGDHSPRNIHHRPSAADGILDPVPGFLVGGPNPGQSDNVDYPSDLPAKSYVDVEGSYASNEIAINWNAPFVYLAAALQFYDAENQLTQQ